MTDDERTQLIHEAALKLATLLGIAMTGLRTLELLDPLCARVLAEAHREQLDKMLDKEN